MVTEGAAQPAWAGQLDCQPEGGLCRGSSRNAEPSSAALCMQSSPCGSPPPPPPPRLPGVAHQLGQSSAGRHADAGGDDAAAHAALRHRVAGLRLAGGLQVEQILEAEGHAQAVEARQLRTEQALAGSRALPAFGDTQQQSAGCCAACVHGKQPADAAHPHPAYTGAAEGPGQLGELRLVDMVWECSECAARLVGEQLQCRGRACMRCSTVSQSWVKALPPAHSPSNMAAQSTPTHQLRDLQP